MEIIEFVLKILAATSLLLYLAYLAERWVAKKIKDFLEYK